LSLAFGTLYAEAQRRYLESVAPYARRLFHQMAHPHVDEIDGIPFWPPEAKRPRRTFAGAFLPPIKFP
jgi:excinuclease UvrABC ATPase subunit